ncbi:MAG: efflux RND transporter periplasmic adaptor subunit [Waddliaceae bacterium]
MPGINHQIFWIAVVIAATIVLSTASLYFSARTTKADPEPKPSIVEIIVAERTEEPVIVTAFGTVRAKEMVTLRTEVSGRVIEESPNLTPGGIVQKDEILFRIDPTDYLLLIEQAKAAVETASFELRLEKGRQVIAKREWEELGSSIKTTELSEELALRKPHLKEKEVALASAKSRLKKSNIDLKRTVIRSPMEAIVITEDMEVGDYVTPQNSLAALVGTDRFRIQVSIPAGKLPWISIPHNKEEKGSAATVIQDLGNISVARQGEVVHLLGDLDVSGRMARLIVEVKDPLSLKDPSYRDFPLLIGSYVRVEIEGPPLKDVFILPREALRENDTVWIKNADNQLESRPVRLVQKREDAVVIDEGISDGEEVITSKIPLPIPGMQVETVEESAQNLYFHPLGEIFWN